MAELVSFVSSLEGNWGWGTRWWH